MWSSSRNSTRKQLRYMQCDVLPKRTLKAVRGNLGKGFVSYLWLGVKLGR
jgi:hypothetical protein